ncbi:MAG: universal stress protein [Alphaproteobacteria bacterium]|nr:universal stress protein [Alphaproteobacteria bacterium]
MPRGKPILVPVDGSACSDRAVRAAIDLVGRGVGDRLHLLNVQPDFGGVVATFVPRAQIETYHREEGEKALASAVAIAKEAGVRAETHIGVGRHGPTVRDFVASLGIGMVMMGTRGHTGLAGVLLGSVAQDVVAHVDVPVCLVK